FPSRSGNAIVHAGTAADGHRRSGAFGGAVFPSCGRSGNGASAGTSVARAAPEPPHSPRSCATFGGARAFGPEGAAAPPPPENIGRENRVPPKPMCIRKGPFLVWTTKSVCGKERRKKPTQHTHITAQVPVYAPNLSER
ncbi:hypothetical protein, partial [Neisseria dumasiana]|uniref:hypothetical protein n=1 Tax=Neisseria dumasiana TaxID=1931275 RepID=UPI001C5B09E7